MSGKTPTALAPAPMATTTIQGRADAVGSPLRAPASGAPCVHWRLRIFEQVSPGMELVHEIISPEPVEIAWRAHADRPTVRVRLAVEDARLQALPALFRQGTPGALAVAKQFGLRGNLRVEEVIIRPGEALAADGVLCDPSAALSHGPFRTIDAPLELLEVTLRLETGLSLRPMLLPWALGTAAALLSTVGVASVLMHWWEGHGRRISTATMPSEIGAKRFVRTQWP